MVLNTNNLNNLTPEEIVNLLIGSGITVDNIKVTGANVAIGSFGGGKSEGLAIDEGVILSSGSIADAVGPNDSDGTGQDLGIPGDQDLNDILNGKDPSDRDTDNTDTTDQTGKTNDAIVLEFDFIPKNEQFTFEYLFASDEYNEYANSSFNDIFAFLLNENNIALIPGTTKPVSINNINASNNSAFFRNNDPSDLEENPFKSEFDGFTTKLAARGFVTPGKKQHLKLVIADTTDGILDSAVFLKKGSLSTLPPSPDASLDANNKGIFNVKGSPGFAQLEFSLAGTNAKHINEVGVFVVDDEQGTINDVKPGEKDYEKLALTGVRSRALFTSLADGTLLGDSQTRLLNYDVGEKLGFYLVSNGTTDMMLSDTPLFAYKPKPQVFFSFPEENPDKLNHLKISEQNGIQTLAWEDSLDDKDFDDLVLKLEVVEPSQSQGLTSGARRQGEVQKEIIDLSNLDAGKSQEAKIKITTEAEYKNTVGLYQIIDPQGTVVDPISGKELTPDDKGYAAAAIRQKVVEFNNNGESSQELDSGLFAPFMIVNGNAETWLQENPNNRVYGDTMAYFPFMNANGEGLDYEHIVLLGDNTFGFEDLRLANTDSDFNDAIMEISFVG